MRCAERCVGLLPARLAKLELKKKLEESKRQLRDERLEDSILPAGQPFKHPSVTVTYSNQPPPPTPPFLLGDADPVANLKKEN